MMAAEAADSTQSQQADQHHSSKVIHTAVETSTTAAAIILSRNMMQRPFLTGARCLRGPLTSPSSVIFVRTFRADRGRVDVILTSDVPSFGYAKQIVAVRHGYARNNLIPRKLAVYDNEDNRRRLQIPIKPRMAVSASVKEATETEAIDNTQTAQHVHRDYFTTLTRRMSKLRLSFNVHPREPAKADSPIKGAPIDRLRLYVAMTSQYKLYWLRYEHILLDKPLSTLGEHQVPVTVSAMNGALSETVNVTVRLVPNVIGSGLGRKVKELERADKAEADAEAAAEAEKKAAKKAAAAART